MSLFEDPCKDPPLFVHNEFEFWLVEDLTEYAERKGLVDIRVFITRDKLGNKNYLIVKGQDPIKESKEYEAIAVFIDIMAADKDMK